MKMIVSSNGGAMTASHSRNMRRRRRFSHEELLAELNFDCRLVRNIKKLLSNNFALEFPASAISHVEQAHVADKCMRSVIDRDAAEVAASVIADLIEEMSEDECIPELMSFVSCNNPTWSNNLDRILVSSPWYVDDTFKQRKMHSCILGLAMTHSCMSAWLVREACASLVEWKGFPRISSLDQALMYLISGNNCHSQIGKGWFAQNPDRLRPRSWWFDRHPHLAFFYGAHAASSGTDLLGPAFAD